METYASVANDEGRLRTVFAEVQASPIISTQAKEKFIEELLKDVEPDSPVWMSWSEETRQQALLTLKTLSRVPEGSQLIYSPRGVTLLMTHGGLLAHGANVNMGKDTLLSRESLKCLSNCFLQHAASLAEFEKNEGVVVLLRLLKKAQNGDYSTDAIFLYARLLFVCTATNEGNAVNIVDKYDGVDILAKILANQVMRLLQTRGDALSDITLDGSTFTTSTVVGELLKIVFNLQHHYRPSGTEEGDAEAHTKFESILEPALTILKQYPTPQPLPLVPPVSNALHVLLNFPVAAYREIWFPKGELGLVHRLDSMLRDSLEYFLPVQGGSGAQTHDPDAHAREKADDVLPVLVIVLTKVAREHEEARKVLKKAYLPGESERILPVDKGESLSARLIRLLTSVRLQKLKHTVGALLFSICDNDAAEFVKAVGYGNAAGFFVMNSIPFPSCGSTSSSDEERPYDLVTGQYLDAAQRANAELAAMTDEEKEREAEKLFVLFERLNKTGIITAENPVGKAIREGKV